MLLLIVSAMNVFGGSFGQRCDVKRNDGAIDMRLTEEDLFKCLSVKFNSSEYALLPQVRDSTGSNAQRTADAIALSLWPSRGLHLHGFEIKVSRGDFIKEIKTPEKAECISKYCHFWWIVVPDGLVSKEEMPVNWGLIYAIPEKKDVKIVKKAELLTPVDPSMSFWAAVLRRAQATITEDSIRTRVRNEIGLSEFNRGVKSAERDIEHAKAQLKSLCDQVNKFENDSGVSITSWRNGNIGVAVSEVVSGAYLKTRERMNRMLEDAECIVKTLREMGYKNE